MSWNGTEPPDGADLLETARATLLESIVPGLAGDARFKALMVANAMAIAARELRLGTEGITAALDALHAHPLVLCAEIRAGARDDDMELAEKLRTFAEERCRISSR